MEVEQKLVLARFESSESLLRFETTSERPIAIGPVVGGVRREYTSELPFFAIAVMTPEWRRQ